MEISTLSANLTALLGPFLPYLLKTGGNLANQVAEKVSALAVDSTFSLVKVCWERLLTTLDNDDVARSSLFTAVKDYEENPSDEDLQVVLRYQLRKLLESNPTMAVALAEDMCPQGDTDKSTTVFDIKNQVARTLTNINVVHHLEHLGDRYD